jgi:(E)-4-hydroxy-3-methylbut-2-enyl-diphosphate synthase
MRKKRRDSRVVWVGEVPVGGDHPIVVQSMTTTDTRNVEATVKQIISLQEAGCELIRVAVLDREAAQALASIKARIKIPLIADIHFDHRLALESIKAGCDGLRINPGNIGAKHNKEKNNKPAAAPLENCQIYPVHLRVRE